MSNVFPNSVHHLERIRNPDGVKWLHHCVDGVCFHPTGKERAFLGGEETSILRQQGVAEPGSHL